MEQGSDSACTASTGQLVLATLSGHLVVIKFEALEEETKGNVAEDSVHLLKLSSSISSAHAWLMHLLASARQQRVG